MSTPLRDQIDVLVATVRAGLQTSAASSALDSLSDVTLLLEARALTAEARLADCEKASEKS